MDTPAQNEPQVPLPDHVIALAGSVSATLQLARALVQVHRQIDLSGLDQEVGRLCAAALDVPLAEGEALRPQLLAVLADLDALVLAVSLERDCEP